MVLRAIIIFVVMSLYLVINLIDILGYTYHIQLKEYRFDKLYDYFRFDEGKTLLLNPSTILNTVLNLIGTIAAFIVVEQAFTLISVLLGLSLLIRIIRVVRRGLLRPKFTAKAIVLLLSTATITFIAIKQTEQISLLLPFSILLTTPFIIFGISVLLAIPTNFLKRRSIHKATQKILANDQLTTIGITGSYGKSSTKVILAGLLGYPATNILVTPKNINTEIGIARLILTTLEKKHTIFVAEMGAYRKNEIELLAKMTKPQIGIITAIGEQHLSLFGSKENIRIGKSELVKNLTGAKIAILNAENLPSLQTAQELDPSIKKYFFSTKAETKADCKLIHFQESELGTQNILVEVNGKSLAATVHLPAPYLISNVLAAILAAHLQGVPLEKIQERLQNIRLGQNQIKYYESEPGFKIIDDSYNGNPTGLAAAINLLNRHANRKIIITRGLLELGKRSLYHHETIAKLIVAYNMTCIVIKKTAFLQFQKACELNGYKTEDYFIFIPEAEGVVNYLKHDTEQATTILLANRVPALIKNYLKAKV